MRRSKALALVFLGSTLIVGAAAGFTVDRVLARNVCERTDDRSSFREHLARKLELTPSQRASVDTILDKRRRDLDAVYDPLQPQLDSARAAVLAPVEEEELRRVFNLGIGFCAVLPEAGDDLVIGRIV